jgi:hypothetical protein
VAERHAVASTGDHRRVRQQRRARLGRESTTKQEIAIAVHQIDRHAGIGKPAQRGGNLGRERRVGFLVPYPELEKSPG